MDRRTIEETTVGGQIVQLLHDDVPIELIELDYDNPRIKYKLSLQFMNGGKPTEKDLEKIILDLPDVRKLRRDIEHNKGLRERVILQKNGNGKYKAVEGNCRTVCVRDLSKKNPKDSKWKKVPAKVLPEDVDPKQKAILLTDFHVAGKIKWDAHEKAGQIYYMSRELGMSQDDIVIYHHSSKATVNRMLTAYGFFVDTFLTIDSGKYSKEGEKKWSYFDEFFKKKELRDELARDPKFGERFCRWIGEGQMPQPIMVRKLADVIKHKEAREKLEGGGAFSEALKLLEATQPEQGSDFFKLLLKTKDAFTSNTQIKEILRIRTDAVARKRLLETYEAMVDFMRLADVDIPKTEDSEA
jgi:hypothetical protein